MTPARTRPRARSSVRTLFLALGCLVALLLAVPAWASHTYPPPPPPTCQPASTTVTPGQSLPVSGTNWGGPPFRVNVRFFQPGATGKWVEASVVTGSFGTTIEVPANAANGAAVIQCFGKSLEGHAARIEAPVTVVGAVASVSFTQDPDPPLGLTVGALIAVAALLAMLVAVRRRREAALPEPPPPAS